MKLLKRITLTLLLVAGVVTAFHKPIGSTMIAAGQNLYFEQHIEKPGAVVTGLGQSLYWFNDYLTPTYNDLINDESED